MKLIFLTGLFLTINFAYAKPVSVDWSCPKGSTQKTSVEIRFDDQGKLQLRPDIFSDNQKPQSAAELTTCILEFQKSASQEIEKFKKDQCPSSKDDLCYSSVSYVNGKLQEKIQASNLVKKNSGISVSAVASGTAATPRSSSAATAEAYLEEKIARKEIDPKNLGQSFTFQNKTYKVSDFDDVISDNIENVFINLSRDEAKQYAQNYLVAKSTLLNAPAGSDERTKVLNNLNQMFGYVYGDKGAEELAKILECKPEDNLKSITEILETLEDTTKVAKCAELKNGEHKVFQKENSNYYSTGNYTLKRKQDGNYQAILNVKFVQNAGASVSSAAMLARSQKCLAQAAPHMKGPDGKTLEIVTLSPAEITKLPKDEQPKEYKVTIEAPGYGTNSGGYAETVDCGTITHEMLHLMGLCDEYLEDRPQYASNNWTCRVVTQAPSVMRDTRAYDQAVGAAINCDCSGQNCSAIMNSGDEDLKKLYTAANINDVVDYQFRNKYCKEDYIYNPPKSMTSPDKAVILEGQTNSGFTLQSRYVFASAKTPYYSISQSRVKCNCPTGDQDCLNKKETFIKRLPGLGVQKWCPAGAAMKGRDRGDNPRGASLKDNVLTLISNPEIPSLLQPNQFNKILEGNCPGKSEGYQKCASYAYKGEPCNVPDICRDDKYYLGSEQ